MKNQNIFVVIPTIRSLTFLSEWGYQFSQCVAIIVEDHQMQEIEKPIKYFKQVYHFTWKDIDHDFGVNNWIFSRKNAGIRSYGFYKAYKLGANVVITLDDDCFPIGKNFIQQHLDNLTFKAASDWFPTYPNPNYIYTRGFPYQVRDQLPVVLSHGLWSGAIDLDAKTEVLLPKLLNENPYPPLRQVIPFGYFFPMCSMNLAFRREVMPLMYFPLMGYDPQGKLWGFDRYDDIWAGLLVKKICDHLQLAIINGSPYVEHRKASNPTKNLEREKRGLKVNEILWQQVKNIRLTKTTPVNCYKEMIKKVSFPREPYFTKLRQAMSIWVSLFN